MNLTAPNGTSPAMFLQAGSQLYQVAAAIDIIERVERKIKEVSSNGVKT